MSRVIDSHEPELVEIPQGTFTMGDVWGDGEPDEHPVYSLTLKPLLLGKYAVTNIQFARFLNEYGKFADKDEVWVDLRNKNNPICWTGERFACDVGCEDKPVTFVNWLGASAYCAWLSEVLKKRVRLPREIEWQYASGGPDGLKWSLGNTFNKQDYICGKSSPGPVRYGEPSPWGLFNMTGNIFEWVEEEYRFALNGDGNDNLLRQNRVIKGGAFILNDSMNFRNSKRFSCHERSCLYSIGFRVAVSLD